MLYKHCVGSFARVLSFMQAAALGSMGSQLPFAAIRLNVRFADKAGICCTKSDVRKWALRRSAFDQCVANINDLFGSCVLAP